MQGDQLKMDSGAPPCYGDNTLQPPKSHTTGCSTKVAPLCTLKRRATGQSVHLIQHRSSKGQTGTLSPSSATDCSSSPVDCQTVSFSSKFRFFFFFLSSEECFICNCNNVREITITKAIFIWSGGFFSQHIMVLPGIKTLVKSSLWHISRLNNQIFVHKFGPIAKKQTKAVILAGYNALAICFPSGSHFLQDVN